MRLDCICHHHEFVPFAWLSKCGLQGFYKISVVRVLKTDLYVNRYWIVTVSSYVLPVLFPTQRALVSGHRQKDKHNKADKAFRPAYLYKLAEQLRGFCSFCQN